MMRSSNASVLAILLMYLTSGTIAQSNCTWSRAKCQNRPVSVLQVYDTIYFPPGFLEILDSTSPTSTLYWSFLQSCGMMLSHLHVFVQSPYLFSLLRATDSEGFVQLLLAYKRSHLTYYQQGVGVVVFTRSNLTKCGSEFGIPLPFKAKSITYTLSHFYVVRDIESKMEPNIYRIADYDLFGGFVFWLKMTDYQSDNCSNLGDNSIDEICELSLNVNSIKSQVEISSKNNKLFGFAYFEKLLSKFLLINSFPELENKVWIWMDWQLHDLEMQPVTKVQTCDSYSVHLITIQFNFQAVLLPAYRSHGTTKHHASSKLQLISITCFKLLSEFAFVGLDIDGNYYLLHDNLQLYYKIGTSMTGARQIFRTGLSSELLVLDSARTVYTSENCVSEIIKHDVICNHSIPLVSGCLYPQTITELQPLAKVTKSCHGNDTMYTPNATEHKQRFFQTQAGKWKTFKGHNYRVFTNLLTHDTAKSLCRNYNGPKVRAHLAVVKTLELQNFIVDLITQAVASKIKTFTFWLGANQNTRGWRWEDGSEVPVPTPVETDVNDTSSTDTSGSGSGSETTVAPDTTTQPLDILKLGLFWKKFAFNQTDIGLCLGLGNENASSESYGWIPIPCSATAMYICEMYPITWDVFPNATGIDPANDEVVFTFSKVFLNVSSPETQCAEQCLQKSKCFTFILNYNTSDKTHAECYGTNFHNTSIFNRVTPMVGQVTGYLRAAETLMDSAQEPIAFVATSQTYHLDDTMMPSEVLCATTATSWDNCTKLGCYYHKSNGNCYAKFLPATVTLRNLGCWWHNVKNTNITPLDDQSFYLDGSFRTRHFALLKCYVAARSMGLKAFALQNGGMCFGSTGDPEEFLSQKSMNCLNDGKGGYMSNQVYAIPDHSEKLLRALGPFIIHPDEDLTVGITVETKEKLVPFTVDHDPFYLVLSSDSLKQNVSVRMKTKDAYIRANQDGSIIAQGSLKTAVLFNYNQSVDGNDTIATFELADETNQYLTSKFDGLVIADGLDSAATFKLAADLNECDIKPQYRWVAFTTTVTKQKCLETGYCYHATSSVYPDCFVKKQTGAAFSNDLWLKSIYSSYEYAVVNLESPITAFTNDLTWGTMQVGRQKCVDEGGELAYVGLDNELEYEHMIFPTFPHQTPVWVGITRNAMDGNFVTLQGATVHVDIILTNSETCVVFLSGILYGLDCTTQIKHAFCQRLSARCNIDPEFRQACLSGQNFNKADCILQGCCYEEPVSGNPQCYTHYSPDDDVLSEWKVTPYSDYAYYVTSEVAPSVEHAQSQCWEHGGELAFFDLFVKEAFMFLVENVLPSDMHMWIAFYYNSTQLKFLSRNNDSIEYPWMNNHIGGSETQSCLTLANGTLLPVSCDSTTDAVSLCQKLRQVPNRNHLEETIFTCKQNYSLCDKHQGECHENAFCVDDPGSFHCVCKERFTGNGKVCIEMIRCPPGWKLFETSCFFLQADNDVDFYQAEEKCMTIGGHLISLHSQQEQLFVQGLMKEMSVLYIWIGLMMEPGTSTAFWIDESPCGYGCADHTESKVSPVCMYMDSSNSTGWQVKECLRTYHLLSYGQACKIDLKRPTEVSLYLSSYPADILPVFASLLVNGKHTEWSSRERNCSLVGCIHVTGHNNLGKVIWYNNSSMWIHDGSQQALDLFAEELKFVAIVTEGKWSNEAWKNLSALLNQNGIILPQQESDASENKFEENLESAYFGSFVMLCRRLQTENFYCPINSTGRLYGEPVKGSIFVPVLQHKEPVLVTFDELLHLGSPPLDLRFTKLHQGLKWRPLIWNWMNSYAQVVTGVRSRALRFSHGNQAVTSGNLCWGSLSTEQSCKHGLTVSFWIRVMSWPKEGDLIVFNTGGITKDRQCKGWSLFISTAKGISLVIHTKTQYSTKSFSVIYRKWTNVWFNVSSVNQVRLFVDLVEVTEVTRPSVVFNGSRPSCNKSTFVVGSNSTDGEFDLDEMVMFDESLTMDETKSIKGNIPVRHRWIDEVPSIESAPSTLSEETCKINKDNFHKSCGRFENQCIGSTILCSSGFTVSFQIKVSFENDVVFDDNLDHIFIFGNLPHTAIIESSNTFGFRVQLSKKEAEPSEGPHKWVISLLHKTETHDRIGTVDWLLDRNVSVPFWIQYHENGKWFFCKRWPDFCKTASTTAVDNLESKMFESTDLFPEFLIGPILVKYVNNKVVLAEDRTYLSNLWIIEQSLDIVEMTDETNMLSSPMHFQVHDDVLKTKDGTLEFKKRGKVDRISASFAPTLFNRRIGLWNYANLLSDNLTPEETYGWLEIEKHISGSGNCLHDVLRCENGFTIQFWFKSMECKEWNGECYIISSGTAPWSRGFSFYRTLGRYFVEVSTGTKMWTLEVWYKSYDYGLIRISWHPDNGLSFYVNDVREAHTYMWKDVVTDRYEQQLFAQFQSVVIGRRNDFPSGFSVFVIAEIHFWDGVANGLPFMHLGSSCLTGWHQIGESCFKVFNTSATFEEAQSICSDVDATLPSITSLAQEYEIEKFLDEMLPIEHNVLWFYLDVKYSSDRKILVWQSTQEVFFNKGTFNGFYTSVRVTATDETAVIVIRSSENSGSFYGWSTLPSQTYSSTGVLCSMPFVKDPFLHGCSKIPNLVGTTFHDSADIKSNSQRLFESYDLSLSCRQFCASTRRSLLSMVQLNNCICFAYNVSLHNVPNPEDPSICYHNNSENLQTLDHFSYENRKAEYKNLSFCGFAGHGGIYRCGNRAKATMYSFNSLVVVYSRAAVTTATFVVKPTGPVEVGQHITVGITRVHCCSPENVVGDLYCHCGILRFLIIVNFDDGSNYTSYMTAHQAVNLELKHFYDQPGIYEIKLEVISSVRFSRAVYVVPFEVYESIENVRLGFIRQVLTEPGQLAAVETVALTGLEMICRWEYHDGSPHETLSVKCPPIPTAYHRYLKEGNYETTVSCRNRLNSWMIKGSTVVVSRIRRLVASTEAVVAFGNTYKHFWKISTGSQVKCLVNFANFSTPEVSATSESLSLLDSLFYFDDFDKTGYAQITKTTYAPNSQDQGACPKLGLASTYILVLACCNLVTNPVPVIVSYVTFDVPISGVQLTVDKNVRFIRVKQQFCVTLTIGHGTNILVKWDFGDFSNKNLVEVCGIDECFLRMACESYDQAGHYKIRVSAMNSYGILSNSVSIRVEYSVSGTVLTSYPVLKPGGPTTATLYHAQPVPSGYVDVCFGDDGACNTYSLKFTESGTFAITHSYTEVGHFNISMYIYNNVSSMNISTNTRIGLPLDEVNLSVTSNRYLKAREDKLVMEVELKRGSLPLYTVDFGDNSSKVLAQQNFYRASPDHSDIQVFTHTYLEPGSYKPILTVANVFGHLELTTSEPIVVENSLIGGDFVLVADQIDVVQYPPGVVTLDAHLENVDDGNKNDSVQGWASNVRVTWLIANARKILLQSKAIYDIDLFPATFVLTRKNLGENEITAALTNHVSSRHLIYNFLLIEDINEPILDIFSAKLPQLKGISHITQGQFINAFVNQSLFFQSKALNGSYIRHHISYGDGNSKVVISPFPIATDFVAEFTHMYTKPEKYDINMNLTNAISSTECNFPKTVHVFEEIKGASITAQFIDISETTGIDVFSHGSELYNLFYGKVGYTTNTKIYFPLNRAITFRTTIERGSNVTMNWTILLENATVRIIWKAGKNPNAYLLAEGLQQDITNSPVKRHGVRLKLLPKVTRDQLDAIGSDFADKQDTTHFAAESSMLVSFENPGTKLINVNVSNAVSSSFGTLKINVLAAVENLKFEIIEPPTANRTANLTLFVEKFGTNSCFVIDPGDFSPLVAFGTTDECIKDNRINPENFFLLVEDQSDFYGKVYLFYEYSGDLQDGSGFLYFTYQHNYTSSGVQTIRAMGFNHVSYETTSSDITVTEILCDYPYVFIEKGGQNSLAQPQRIASIVEFRLFALIRLNCRSTSKFAIQWDAHQIYKMTHDSPSLNISKETDTTEKDDKYVTLPSAAQRFANSEIKFKKIDGLQYSPKSEGITIPKRFLPIGLHLVCVNVAMIGEVGINQTDCIHIRIVRPPLVAGIQYGVRRAVGYGDEVSLDAASSSYDPVDGSLEELKPDLNSTKFEFLWSCPYEVGNESNIEENVLNLEDEIDLMFGGKLGWAESIFCGNIDIACPNVYRVLHILSFSHGFNGTDWLENLKLKCENQSSCYTLVSDLYMTKVQSFFEENNLTNTEFSKRSEPITPNPCVNVKHRCHVPENSLLVQFYQSPNDCVTSGYYPKTTTGKIEHCESLVWKQSTSCGLLRVDTSHFDPGASYIIRVRIKDPLTDRIAHSFQVLDISREEPSVIKIVCKYNCNLKTNTRTSLTLHVNLTTPTSNGSIVLNETSFGANSSLSLKWSLFVSNGKKTRRRRDTSDDEFVPVYGLEGLSSVGVSGPYLVIKPHSLLPGMKYRVRVDGEVGLTSPGWSETELLTNLPPYNGGCDIEPSEGVALNDTFTITCFGWKDEGLYVDRSAPISENEFILLYQVYVYTAVNATPILLSFGNNPVIADKFLPPGLPSEDYRVKIHIRIWDEYGESTSVKKNVKVFESQNFQLDLLTNISNSNDLISNTQELTQISTTVSSILNTQAEQNTSMETTQQKQERMTIRSKLMNDVVSRITSDSDLDDLQQSCSAIGTLTHVTSEVDPETQHSAINAISDQSNTLLRLSNNKPFEDVEETASAMVAGIDNVMKAARNQLIAQSKSSDTTNSLVELPIFTHSSTVLESDRAVLDDEENYLSPQERTKRRDINAKDEAEFYKQKREESRHVGNQAIKSMSTLSSAVLKRRVPGEPSVGLSTSGFNLQSQTTTAEQLCQPALNETGQNLGTTIRLAHCDKNQPSVDVGLETEILTLENNPFIWDDSADKVQSSVVSFTLRFTNGTNAFKDSNNIYEFDLPVDPKLSVPPQLFNFTPSGYDQMSYHEFKSAAVDDVVFLCISPEQENVRLRIYFLLTDRYNEFPKIDNNTFVRELPNVEDDPHNPYRIRLNGSELEDYSRYVFGIHEIDEMGNVTVSNGTLFNYTLSTLITSCRFWNEAAEKWETQGCELSSKTTSRLVKCVCNHLTSFAAGFLVAPNPIDFAKLSDKIKDLKDNLAVLLTLVVIFVLYIIGLVACRRQDKNDVKKWSISLLVDNKLNSEYFYQIAVQTGRYSNAETTSRIYFVLTGDKADTRIRTLADSNHTRFKHGSVRKFLMIADRPLGTLTCLKIWHDNSGKDSLASWYLDQVVVTDLQTNKRFYFICNDWLAVDESDGMIERVIPPAGDQLASFRNLFTSSTTRDFSDGHLWFSLFSRPTRSNFTRIQRLSCAFSLLLTTMLTSAMFYGKDSEDSGLQGRIEIGPLSLSVQQLLISIQASLIVLPLNIIIVQMFRRIRAKESDDLTSNVKSLVKESTLDILNRDANEQHKGTLPRWFIYISWLLVSVVSVISFSFVFIYSIEWGPQKSNDWLVSIVFSFTQSIFVIQPAKVIIGAVVVSFLVNRFAKEKAEEIVEDNKQVEINVKDFRQKEMEWITQCPIEDDHAQTEGNQALNSKQLKAARRKREHYKQMIHTLHDIGAYILYVILILVATNIAKDPNSFLMHRSVSKIFLETDPLFDEIQTVENFWEWADCVLVRGLHADNWYNGRRVTWMETRFLANRETFVIGPARIRQVRSRTGDCIVNRTITTSTKDCLKSYHIVNQETDAFNVGWITKTDEQSAEAPWMFQNVFKLGGVPFHGELNWYDGGGYTFTLDNTAHGSRSILDKLKKQNWIDRNTAAIFVEFTVYNANINLFASCILTLERSETGAFLAFPSITPVRLYEFIDGKGTILVVVQIVFVVVLIYRMYMMLCLIRTVGKTFFNSFWNLVDIFSSLLSLCAIALYAVKTLSLHSYLEKISRDLYKENFVNLQYVTFCNEMFRYFMAFTLFLATIKFNQILAFNQRIRLLAITLCHAATPIAYFLSMFSIYFMAFLFCAHIWFEQKLLQYSTVLKAGQEMFSMLVGRFDFTELQNADRFLGPIFFITFAGLCTILLINMFIVILDDSIKAARREVDREKNKFEMIDFLKQKMTGYFFSMIPNWIIKKINTDHQSSAIEMVETPFDALEKRVDVLVKVVSSMEADFYAKTSIQELEMELEEDKWNSENELDNEDLYAIV